MRRHPCVLLLMPTTTYKSADFLAAAAKLGVDVVVGTDRRQVLEAALPGHTLALDPRKGTSLRRIVDFAATRPLHAVVGTDDETTTLAARAAQALGLPHNSPLAVRAARDKLEMRRRLAAAGLRGPAFRTLSVTADPRRAATRASYPCVLKPRSLAASRGVIRVDDRRQFVAAFRRVAAILRQPDVRHSGAGGKLLLVEQYMPGPEFALEGLLRAGRLRVLALFDKPDPLEGPTFEETLYVTPSRLPRPQQARIAKEAERACAALGLVEGPVHAELRLWDGAPCVLEVAPRTIGGLCSRTLRFGTGVSLEELVLRHGLGQDTRGLRRERAAAGVMMLPIPRAGRLQAVSGVDAARGVRGIVDVVISAPRGAELVPLPEGHRYLGFLFARAATPRSVEAALRRAQAKLQFTIEPRQGTRTVPPRRPRGDGHVLGTIPAAGLRGSHPGSRRCEPG